MKAPEMESGYEGMNLKAPEMESGREGAKALKMESNLCAPFCDAHGTTCRHRFHGHVLSLLREPVGGEPKGVQLFQVQGPGQQKWQTLVLYG